MTCKDCKYWTSAIAGSDSGMCCNPESPWESALRYACDSCEEHTERESGQDVNWRARAEKAEANVVTLADTVRVLLSTLSLRGAEVTLPKRVRELIGE
jgi:hypothetical protein